MSDEKQQPEAVSEEELENVQGGGRTSMPKRLKISKAGTSPVVSPSIVMMEKADEDELTVPNPKTTLKR